MYTRTVQQAIFVSSTCDLKIDFIFLWKPVCAVKIQVHRSNGQSREMIWLWDSIQCYARFYFEGASTHIAIPMPPPIQSEATPLFFPSLCMEWSSVTSIRHPDAPIGWPKAMAPPKPINNSVRSSLSQKNLCEGPTLYVDFGLVHTQSVYNAHWLSRKCFVQLKQIYLV